MPSAIALLVLSPSARAVDYDGDGIDDLVVGVPYQDFDPIHESAGAIEVILGSSDGLTSTGDAFLHQGTTGVSADHSWYDNFGFALDAGDVDGDGNTDLVVGGKGEEVSYTPCGAIWRLELAPTRTSLSVTTSQMVTQSTRGVSDTCEEGDGFGTAVLVADFDLDGYDDVVVGSPYEGVGTEAEAGAVHYLRGGSAGLTTSGQLYYSQESRGAASSSETEDRFGRALAAGDFDGDRYPDLVVGAPYEDWWGVNEGAAHVMYGSSSGPQVASPDDEMWTAGWDSIAGPLADENRCGSALTVGDFDADGYDDLAIGCPGGPDAGEGFVLVVYGSSRGLDASEVWGQDSAGVFETAETGDNFGNALTSGDYDGDGYDDLAVGAPGEDASGLDDSGMVNVLRGSASGLTDAGDVLVSQSGSAIPGTPGEADGFGAALTTGDYDDDGYDDLAVGAPWDADNGVYDAGTVNVFYGTSAGLSTTGAQLFDQDTSGIDDASEASDSFGYSLR